ncbi:hypothetical protein CcCBS67573_g05563 [Chytriomyces confervae]|uniref:Guanylate cyclase domain-containing protein n=1 Tax=Chytriomyces confervae TaxID=246404 RepID=A0A507FC68_9FUNG|nr:hypothetical protein CcCBS67573_g05563 [Chytriomyces confervae]
MQKPPNQSRAIRHLLIAGLGNTSRSINSRHNVGMATVDHLAQSWDQRGCIQRAWTLNKEIPGYVCTALFRSEELNFPTIPEKKQVLVAAYANKAMAERLKNTAKFRRMKKEKEEGAILEEIPAFDIAVSLIKPKGSINLSGPAILKAMSAARLSSPSNILVVHDQMRLRLGKTHVTNAKTHDGHNGIRSIQSSLNSWSFERMQVGIGSPSGTTKDAFVLDSFPLEAQYVLENQVFKNAEDIKNVMSAKGEFSQSAAVTRCRKLKETKLRAQQVLAKLADEEVTIYSAKLEDARHQLKNQLVEQTSVNLRQEAEAKDVKISWERKEQLTKLVDKLTAIKSVIRFQQEARDREVDFKASVRQKMSAFQVRLAKLEQCQLAERNELLQSQTRLAETVSQIRAIEVKAIKDKNRARRLQKEHDILAEQESMRQKKESEFLRTVQLCKSRQMGEMNDLEIQNLEEIEDLSTQQRLEEFDTLAEHAVLETAMLTAHERHKGNLLADQLREKQKGVKVILQRAQKQHAANLAKAQKKAVRDREKILLAEHTIIKGSVEVEDVDHGNMSDSDGGSDAQSETGTDAAHSRESLRVDGAVAPVPLEISEGSNGNVKSVSESDKEMSQIIEQGNERYRSLIEHHKSIIGELKRQHSLNLSQKTKEAKRKIADLLKNHEEEIRQLKAEQENSMKELMESQLTTDDKDADKKASQIHHGVILPAHIVERIEAGQPVVPEQFECVTVFFTEIYGFKNLVATVDPVKMIHLLDKMYKQFDQIISKYSQIFKVESVSHTYLLASGLSASRNESEVSECAHQALTCANALKDWVAKTDFSSIVGNVDIKLCIGIHSGPASGALIATKVGRYCLFGETVQLASRMCATAESNKIQVSPMTIQVLGLDDNFEFAERGDIDIKTQGKSKMCTYWLLSDEDDM